MNVKNLSTEEVNIIKSLGATEKEIIEMDNNLEVMNNESLKYYSKRLIIISSKLEKIDFNNNQVLKKIKAYIIDKTKLFIKETYNDKSLYLGRIQIIYQLGLMLIDEQENI